MAPPVTSNLIVQFDAGTIGQSDNTAVSSWAPASGAETAAATQATGGQQPTFRTNQINGLPAVLFTNAGSSNLDTGAWGSSYAVPNTAFAVAKMTNTATDTNVFSGRTGVFDYLGVTGSGTQVAIGAGFAAEVVATFTPGSAFHIYCAVYNFTTSALYIDSTTAAATGSTGSAASSNMPGMRIGSNSSGSAAYPDGAIAEILFYNRALSASEITQMVAYLATKYALSAAGLGPVRSGSVVAPSLAATQASSW